MAEIHRRDGHTITIHDGAGPAVVLLSGCALNSGCWADVVAALPGRRIITVDRPGYLGTASAGLPSLPEQVRVLARILEEVEARPVIVVAHSMAAFQAEALARLRPRLVAGMVLVDPSAEPDPLLPLPGEDPCARALTRAAGAAFGYAPVAALA
ncbi:alpha/beta fold hydrolase, partial [Actinomyces sp. MRS3W]|uniref:alpha/beta fold hydrolase n=1 Tax=Actinomyces sp. MRS3W TaxID=2800796 RepID=UPI0028FD4975